MSSCCEAHDRILSPSRSLCHPEHRRRLCRHQLPRLLEATLNRFSTVGDLASHVTPALCNNVMPHAAISETRISLFCKLSSIVSTDLSSIRPGYRAVWPFPHLRQPLRRHLTRRRFRPSRPRRRPIPIFRPLLAIPFSGPSHDRPSSPRPSSPSNSQTSITMSTSCSMPHLLQLRSRIPRRDMLGLLQGLADQVPTMRIL